jgi:HK97 family phage major capsid protein
MHASAVKRLVENRRYETKSAEGDSGTEDVVKIIEDLGHRFEEFKAANDAQLAEIKKGRPDALTEEKLKKIGDSLDALQAAKDEAERKSRERLDEIEKRMNRLKIVGGTDIDGKSEDRLQRFNRELKSFSGLYSRPAPTAFDRQNLDAYASGFKSYLRRGGNGWRSEVEAEAKAMSVGSDPDGGYLVTPDTSGRIVSRIFDLSPIRQIASVQTIATNALEGIVDRDENDAGWVAESTDRDDTKTAQVGKYKIEAFEMYASPKASQTLIEDSTIDIETWLATKTANKFARIEGTAFVVGNGNGQPKGFASYDTAVTTDETRTAGTLQHILTGTKAGFAATGSADVLFDLLAAFKDYYLQNGRFVTRREVIALVRKFKDSNGQYLWQPSLAAGQPQTLLGFSTTIAQDIPAVADGSLSLAFGDFVEGYQIVDRLGIQTLRDPYTSKPFVKFYTRKRVGGLVVNFDAIKFLKFATA